MVISQPPGNNPSYYYRASPTLPQLSECFPETPYVLLMQLQHQVYHRNGAIKHIFYTVRSTEDHQLIVLYSFCRSMPLHLAVKMSFKSFMWRFEHVVPYICRFVTPPEYQQDRTLLRNQYYRWKHSLIFDINHQQNTRRSDQVETMKTIMQTTLSYHMEGFTNGSGCHF